MKKSLICAVENAEKIKMTKLKLMKKKIKKNSDFRLAVVPKNSFVEFSKLVQKSFTVKLVLLPVCMHLIQFLKFQSFVTSMATLF
jgi:hypothetical protein